MPARKLWVISEPPQFWSMEPDGSGGVRLGFAVRGGLLHTGLVVVSLAFVLGGLWGMYWLVDGGGLTIAGWVFLVLVPGGAVLCGVYGLDRMLWAQTEYVLGHDALNAYRRSVWGAQSTAIARQQIAAIAQYYTPPGDSEAQGSEGTWVTCVVWCGPSGDTHEFVLEGLNTVTEKRWLGPLLAEWAQVPLKRGFSGGLEEADPAELPQDD